MSAPDAPRATPRVARGPAGKELKGGLQREQLLLAMSFNKHGSESDPDVARHMAEVMSLKAQYAALGQRGRGAARRRRRGG